MKTSLKTLAVIAALVPMVGFGAVALAQTSDNALQPRVDCPDFGPRMMHGERGPGAMKGSRFNPDRQLSTEQIRVLTQAHLIRTGSDDTLKVGEIKESGDNAYSVQILKADGTVDRTLELAKNGMPMRRPK